jgi:hypothetical protein
MTRNAKLSHHHQLAKAIPAGGVLPRDGYANIADYHTLLSKIRTSRWRLWRSLAES